MPAKTPVISDREKAGLRGPVRQCTEERTNPAVSGYPEMKFISTTEYDIEGKIAKITHINQDGSKWISSNSYDEQGRLVKTVSGKADAPADETIYHYDEKGRLNGYSGRGAMGSETTRFEYNEHSRKTRIVTSNEPASTNGPYAANSFVYSIEGSDLYYPVSQGGMVKTVYDENDWPIETQVYSAGGEMMQRLVRRYDAAGRPTETRVILGDITGLLPAEMKAQLMNEPGATQEMQRQLAELLGAQNEMVKTSYVYDPEGRLIEKRDQLGYNHETVTSFVYDGNGNKIKETSKTSGDANPPRSGHNAQNTTATADGSRQESEVTYTYKYDSYGNWTEQAMQSKSSPGGTFENAGLTRRTITNY